jgi:geranylgeranyl diphosphate synthase type II
LGLALNAGDALAVLSNQILRRHAACMDAGLADRVLLEFDAMALRTLEGQATELGWRRDGVEELEPEDYLDLIMHKTCWYTTVHPLRVGALVGSAGAADLRPIARFGFYLGAAFQIQDDLLNLLGNELEYGKEIDGDLYEGKRTLPLIHLLRNARGRDRQTVEKYLLFERAERTAAMISEIHGLLNKYESIEFAAAYAKGIAGAAQDAFEAAFELAIDGPDREFVRAAVPYMLDRRA